MTRTNQQLELELGLQEDMYMVAAPMRRFLLRYVSSSGNGFRNLLVRGLESRQGFLCCLGASCSGGGPVGGRVPEPLGCDFSGLEIRGRFEAISGHRFWVKDVSTRVNEEERAMQERQKGMPVKSRGPIQLAFLHDDTSSSHKPLVTSTSNYPPPPLGLSSTRRPTFSANPSNLASPLPYGLTFASKPARGHVQGHLTPLSRRNTSLNALEHVYERAATECFEERQFPISSICGPCRLPPLYAVLFFGRPCDGPEGKERAACERMSAIGRNRIAACVHASCLSAPFHYSELPRPRPAAYQERVLTATRSIMSSADGREEWKWVDSGIEDRGWCKSGCGGL
ncbi:hypothetical protein K438DRAFT_1753640 [Mycena galopus ATCC 62051]|nr:hypothetical protein K438DRAFT_1753640 [Mycena galopus ATCC 62051]